MSYTTRRVVSEVAPTSIGPAMLSDLCSGLTEKCTLAVRKARCGPAPSSPVYTRECWGPPESKHAARGDRSLNAPGLDTARPSKSHSCEDKVHRSFFMRQQAIRGCGLTQNEWIAFRTMKGTCNELQRMTPVLEVCIEVSMYGARRKRSYFLYEARFFQCSRDFPWRNH